MHEQTTTNQPAIHDGDVIEVDGPDGAVTALVLLANAKMVILDLCDDSTPVVIERHSLRPYRVFSDGQIANALAECGFRIRTVRRQFVLPIALHKASTDRTEVPSEAASIPAPGSPVDVHVGGDPVDHLVEIAHRRHLQEQHRPQAAARFPMAREHASSSGTAARLGTPRGRPACSTASVRCRPARARSAGRRTRSRRSRRYVTRSLGGEPVPPGRCRRRRRARAQADPPPASR